jgi:hypothetical protein
MLGVSVEENLELKLVWIQERLVLDDASLSIFVQCMLPLLQCCNIEK